MLHVNQNSFCIGHSTLPHILSLWRIVEEIRSTKKELLFVDFKKAFDSVNREVMFEILPLYGVPDETVQAIKVLCTNTSKRVITLDKETESFQNSTGVLQGDILSFLSLSSTTSSMSLLMPITKRVC